MGPPWRRCRPKRGLWCFSRGTCFWDAKNLTRRGAAHTGTGCAWEIELLSRIEAGVPVFQPLLPGASAFQKDKKIWPPCPQPRMSKCSEGGISFTTGPLILRISFFLVLHRGSRLTGWCGQQGRVELVDRLKPHLGTEPASAAHAPAFISLRFLMKNHHCQANLRWQPEVVEVLLSFQPLHLWKQGLGDSRVLAFEAASSKCENIAQSL
jgi:hypothetical protein